MLYLRTIKEYKQEQRMRGAALQTLRYSAHQFGSPCVYEKPKKTKPQVKVKPVIYLVQLFIDQVFFRVKFVTE